jgi:hypothetical protein
MVGVKTRRTISHVTLISLETCNVGYPPKDDACPDWDAPSHLLFVSVSHLRLPPKESTDNHPLPPFREVTWCYFQRNESRKPIPVYRPHPNPKTLTRRLTARELLRNPAKFCSCGVSCSESNMVVIA